MKLRLLGAILLAALFLNISRGSSKGGEIIVTMKSGRSVSSLNFEAGAHIVRQIPKRGIYLIETDDDLEKTVKKLRQNGSAELVETNGRFHLNSTDLFSEANPNLGAIMADLLDGQTRTTFYGTSVLKAYVAQPALKLIQLDSARQATTGAGTRVAYIDTGVDTDHPALKPWLDPGIDLIANRSVSELDGLSGQMADLLDQQMADLLDDRFFFLLDRSFQSLLNSGPDSMVFPSAFGHGTLVAGMIHVVAPHAVIVPIKAFDPNGYTTMFRVVEGVYAAIDLGVDVLNLSFSTSQTSDTLRKVLAEAHSKGIAIVASVGNDGRDGQGLYPAAYPKVHGVAATDFNDQLASFSNYGHSVAMAAPGAFVVSTSPGGTYAAAWGTSFSAPIVSGSIALVASLKARGNADSNLVINGADSIDSLNPGFENKLGRGRVNVQKALNVR